MNTRSWMRGICAVAWTVLLLNASGAERFEVGAAKADITPKEPIRLSGYGNRTKPNEGVTQRIWTRAMAIKQGAGEIALLVNVENCGISEEIRNEVVAHLQKEKKIRPEAVSIFSTHTHSAPCLTGVIPNLFSSPIIPEEQAVIDKYTRDLVENIKIVCLGAIANVAPARLYWGEGVASFAKNRRTEGGPVDHALPILVARDRQGKVRAIFANYACHCTTLFGEFNTVHGDWAGVAQEVMEQNNPEAVAVMAIGCGADSNPFPRSKLELTTQHGTEIAREVQRLLEVSLSELTEKLICRTNYIRLPFEPHFTREQWEERAKQQGIVGYHAKKSLERLDRGENLPTELGYLVQCWNFGEQLAMVSLPGEVVVDYALRLKKEFNRERLWVNGYANYVPCYIPSERILQEGGYEAEQSLWYYDQPARLSTKTEGMIISAVHDLVPQSFKADPKAEALPKREDSRIQEKD